MADGLEFELVELLDIQNGLMQEITRGRLRLVLIMPKFQPVKPKTGIQIPRDPVVL
jgi:hypothetical protein